MRRVSVVGTSGSGKTTFARTLAGRLGVPHIELDSIYHQPNWTPLPDDEYRIRVGGIVAGPAWVIDGNYSAVRQLVWDSADTVVVLAYPRRVVMRRIIGRSLNRVILRRALWNDNRERWSNLLSRVPEENIALWAWTSYEKNLNRYLVAMSDPRWRHLTFHRFTTPTQARQFLTFLPEFGR